MGEVALYAWSLRGSASAPLADGALLNHNGRHRRTHEMATFIALLDFTDQGLRNLKDSPHRADKFSAMAEQAGARVVGQYKHRMKLYKR